MRAAVFEGFQGPINIQNVADPMPSPTGVVLRVKACGLCRSDWHGWMGNDPDIKLPHVPGHELAGEIVDLGSAIEKFKIGDRVTLPFVCGCGACEPCLAGDQQVCDHQFQPGFTAWGGFAEYVAIEYADANLVRLPVEIDFVTAASLGCRFATSYRAVVDQGKIKPEQWVAVHGCGGVGLSAIMIAAAFGARVIAVDIAEDKLEYARSIGAEVAIDSRYGNPAEAILDITDGGAHISIDALGHPDILMNSLASLRKRGKHIQVGIMEAGGHRPQIPIDKLIGRELEIIGSHGMQAHRYPGMLELIRIGKLEPQKLIGKKISLDKSVSELTSMNSFSGTGVTVIDRF
ncbi:MAG TPA: zinc-dependent alcohol dehydrogenase family protein [Pyrinomonadaceae bacterium]|nr:zinc-dependent alcohol dehydrogenase family protein [Acidobacteriota bacterium]HQZ94989.1 zinc-dependent alcohol dehydrogenase family protein [Pyrinomonadaceae bacterium]